MASSRVERALFLLLIAAFLVVGALFAVRTPAWQAPDEPAHYNYVAQVASNGCCPVLEVGDWNSAYLDALKSARFSPDMLGDLATIQYEDHQPPLYYLLASLVFKLTDGSLIALRLFTVLIGAGVVAGAYAVGKALLPDQPQIALGTALLVGFVPQHVAGLAAVENDALAELIIAVTLWGMIVYLKSGRVKAWQLGILVGVGLLTKVSTLFLAGLVPLAILIKWWIERRGDDRARRAVPVRELIAFAVPALILGGVWWAREMSIYGFPDLFGLARHNLVVADQPRTADLIAQIGVGEYLRRVVETTFDSFWGQFGWMALPLQRWTYALIAVFLGVAAAGWVIGLARPLKNPLTPRETSFRPSPLPRERGEGISLPFAPLAREKGQGVEGAKQRAAWGIVILTALLALAQYAYYNSEFLQLQGRYLYPGLIPLGLGVALGMDGWRRIGRGTPRPYSVWFAPAVIALLIPLDLYIVWRVIPGLAP